MAEAAAAIRRQRQLFDITQAACGTAIACDATRAVLVASRP
jgi:hypothetical protein